MPEVPTRPLIDNINLFTLQAYILTMPFVSAFAFTGTISIPLILSVVMCASMCFTIFILRPLASTFIGFDLLIIALLLMSVLLSFIFNGLDNAKALNHTVAYFSAFLLFYVTMKFSLFNLNSKKEPIKKILQAITYTTLVSAVYANAEFILGNFFAFNLNNYIPRALESEKSYSPTVIEMFIRARGFETESGHFTFMMELFSPLTVYYIYFSSYCYWNKVTKIITTSTIVFSFVFAASSASFVIIPIALILSILIYMDKVLRYIRRNLASSLLVTSFLLALIVIANYYLSLSTLIFLSLTDKLDSVSFDDRQDRIDFFFNEFAKLNWIKKLNGTGPAGFDIMGFDESKSILSLYYSITFELGILGLLLIILLFIYLIVTTIKIRTKLGFFLTVSLVAGIMHYYFISNFWYPWFWFIGTFSIYCFKTLPRN